MNDTEIKKRRAFAIISPENHKSGKKSKKPILRPITKEIEPLIRLLFALSKTEWILDNSGTKDPMSGNASVSIPYNIMQWLRKNKSYEMPHWSLHDLRRTARTNFATLCQPHIAEIMLGHALPRIWATYDQHSYLDEQKAAYQQWITRLKGLVGEL